MNYILRQVLPPKNHDEPIEIHLTEDENTVGRRNKIIPSKYIETSRDHANFYKSEDSFLFVKDLNSLNGLYVNGVRIGSALKSLKGGDIIGFGAQNCQNEKCFVCVVCSDFHFSEVKKRVIDVSDDDDDLPPIFSEPASETCHVTTAVEVTKTFTNKPNESENFTSKSISVKKNEAQTIVKLSNAFSKANITYVGSSNSLQNYLKSVLNKTNVGSSENINLSNFSTLPIAKAKVENFDNFLNVNNFESKDIQSKEVYSVNNCLQNSMLMSTQANDVPSTSQFKDPSNVYEPYAISTLKCSTVTRFENDLLFNLSDTDSLSDTQDSVKKCAEIAKFGGNSLLEKHFLDEKVANLLNICKNNMNRLHSLNNSLRDSTLSKIAVKIPNASQFRVPLSSSAAVNTLLKEISIPLVRCDSKYFKFPSDVKNSFVTNVSLFKFSAKM